MTTDRYALDPMDYDRTGAPITCRHAWHYGPDGLPLCRGDKDVNPCAGHTVACGQGGIPCERHADRRATTDTPAPTRAPMTYTVTVTEDDIVRLIIAAQDRHDYLAKVSAAAGTGDPDAELPVIEHVNAYRALVALLRDSRPNSAELTAYLSRATS